VHGCSAAPGVLEACVYVGRLFVGSTYRVRSSRWLCATLPNMWLRWRVTAARYFVAVSFKTRGRIPRSSISCILCFEPEAALAIVCPIEVSCSYWQYRCDESLQPPLEQLIRNANAARVLRRRKWVLDHILDIQIRPDLMQVLP